MFIDLSLVWVVLLSISSVHEHCPRPAVLGVDDHGDQAGALVGIGVLRDSRPDEIADAHPSGGGNALQLGVGGSELEVGDPVFIGRW